MARITTVKATPILPAETVIGVILAGGLARRMGGEDKILLPLGDRVILDEIIDRLQPQVAALLLNSNRAASRFSSYSLPVAADIVDGFIGPLAGVLTGMVWTRKHYPDCRWIVTVAADTPFFPTDFVTRMQAAQQTEQADIACAWSHGRRHPVFALWPLALERDLYHAVTVAGTRKIRLWTDQFRVAEVDFGTIDNEAADPFFNINTPDDLTRLQAGQRQ